ncbi:nitroreductase family protein [Microbacterium sp. cx-59]|uniref:nitroreductase family protein n=1 Tax=Microbacterium sp. cx-59 TaxID=2891207 RepID=UPI001E3BFC58|nr:nitroreductase family protein [Microbacterium sp. cx-59]MCC4909519.1 nitroreductase family protein [Microbacterium sp. cx-59]
MSTISSRTAVTDRPVLDVFAERWSTRIFDAAAPLDEDAFQSALEAARWAPSASNTQPWRAIVARRGTPEHQQVLDALMGFNQAWAGDASALVVFVTELAREDNEPLPWAVYDTGQAAAFFTIQAHAGGLATHQMGGFHRDVIASTFGLDSRFEAVSIMAVGTLGDPATADAGIVEREGAPRTRRPIAETLIVNA